MILTTFETKLKISIWFPISIDKMKLPIRTSTTQNSISFINASWPGLSYEAYQLFIRPTNIIITAQGSSGAFYAVQSLLSLWEAGKGEVPVLDIRDKPRCGIVILMVFLLIGVTLL